LLVGKSDGNEWPVAWVWGGRRGRVFFTSLGSADDFRKPDFVRLVVNAIEWIGRRGQPQNDEGDTGGG
jgi:type 1 glutamine amidotransferase